MKKRLIVPLLFVLFMLTQWSCHPELDFTTPETEPKLVVWGYLNPDSVISIYLSQSQRIDRAGDVDPIDDALVLLYENQLLIDTLQAQGEGNYLSAHSVYPVAGNAYHIEVSHPGFPLLQTIPDTIPLAPQIESYNAFTEALQGGGFSGNVLAAIQVRLLNESQNGYIGHRIFLLDGGEKEIADFWVPDGFACDNLGVFFNYSLSAFNLSCRSDIRDYQIISTNFEESDLNTAELSVCFFSDKTIEMQEQLGRFHDLNTGSYSVDPFYEPISLPEFTLNGYGFVGGYHCTRILVDF